MIRNSNKKVFLCIAVSIILVVGLMGVASAASGSDNGFFGKVWDSIKNFLGIGGKVTGQVVEGAEPFCGNNIVESGEVCDGNTNDCINNGVAGIQTCNSQCTEWNACTVVGTCDTVEGINPMVPAEVCCVVNEVYVNGACDSQYPYANCVGKWAMANIRADNDLARAKAIDFARTSGIECAGGGD